MYKTSEKINKIAKKETISNCKHTRARARDGGASLFAQIYRVKPILSVRIIELSVKNKKNASSSRSVSKLAKSTIDRRQFDGGFSAGSRTLVHLYSLFFLLGHIYFYVNPLYLQCCVAVLRTGKNELFELFSS